MHARARNRYTANAGGAGELGLAPHRREAPSTEAPSEDEVLEALKSVIDPELGINIVDLGLVYEVDIAEGGDVDIQYTLTTMGCPIGPLIEDQMRAFLAPVPGNRRGQARDGAPSGLDPRDDVGRGQGRARDVLSGPCLALTLDAAVR